MKLRIMVLFEAVMSIGILGLIPKGPARVALDLLIGEAQVRMDHSVLVQMF